VPRATNDNDLETRGALEIDFRSLGGFTLELEGGRTLNLEELLCVTHTDAFVILLNGRVVDECGRPLAQQHAAAARFAAALANVSDSQILDLPNKGDQIVAIKLWPPQVASYCPRLDIWTGR
jgi:hypothetical protein